MDRLNKQVPEADRPPEPYVCHISKDDLQVDEGYQRGVSATLVKRIVDNWNWLYFGVIHVAQENGSFYVFDGQHRLEAARNRNDVDLLPCLLYKGMTQEEAARAFLGINGAEDPAKPTRKPLTNYQKFKAMIVAKNPIAIAIEETLDVLGYKVASSNKSNGASVTAVMAIYNSFLKDTKHSVQALETCAGIMKRKGISKELFLGVFEFSRNADRCDPPIPFEKWKQRLIKLGYYAIAEGIEKYTKAMMKSGSIDCGYGVLNAYNKGLREDNHIEWIDTRRGLKHGTGK